MSPLRPLRAIALLPGMVLVVVPFLLIRATHDPSPAWGLPAPWSVAAIGLGAFLVLMGLALMAWTIGLFFSVGRGTLAPWDPTRRLVVRGPYRIVRNPMISGVMGVLAGEAILLGSAALLGWLACFVLANAIYIPLVEERGLARRFGDDYLLYRKHVPRWIPRLTPWRAPREAE